MTCRFYGMPKLGYFRRHLANKHNFWNRSAFLKKHQIQIPSRSLFSGNSVKISDCRVFSPFKTLRGCLACTLVIQIRKNQSEQTNTKEKFLACKKLFWLMVNLTNTCFHMHCCQDMEVLNAMSFYDHGSGPKLQYHTISLLSPLMSYFMFINSVSITDEYCMHWWG